MFTGIVTGIGTVRKAVTGPGGLELTIASPYRDLEPGDPRGRAWWHGREHLFGDDHALRPVGI